MTIAAPEKKKRKSVLRGEASYALLIGTAMRSFAERGYKATTVDTIIEGTGHTIGAFYHHFRNKGDCLWHVIAYRQQLRGDWPAIADSCDPKTTSLEDVLRRVFAHFEKTMPGARTWTLVMADYYDHHRNDDEAKARLSAIYADWYAEVRCFLDKLSARGYLDENRDLDLLAMEVFSYVEGIMNHAVVYSIDSARENTAIIDGLLRLLA